jgi:hypothetical protein
LFVSKRRLQKQRPQPQKTVLGSIPGEEAFCTLDSNNGRRTINKTNIVCFSEETKGAKVTKPINCPEFEAR